VFLQTRNVFEADVPLSVEGAGSPSNTMWPGPRPTLHEVASWSIQRLATTHQHYRQTLPASVNPKLYLGADVPLSVGELVAHLTQCGLGWGLPPYQVAPRSIQPFGHRIDRQTDNSPIKSDSTGRIVLQTVAQKFCKDCMWATFCIWLSCDPRS